jgi:hemerythrin superfamily protein
MHGPLYQFFADDHKRLEKLLNQATSNPKEIELTSYEEFRKGLLKHIGMEEKILLPAVQRLRGGNPLPITHQLKLDHGALAALMVPPPSRTIIAAIRAILSNHNILEEELDGLYETFERLAVEEVDELLEKLRATTEVPTMPFNSKPFVLEATRRALARAGYNFDAYIVKE